MKIKILSCQIISVAVNVFTVTLSLIKVLSLEQEIALVEKYWFLNELHFHRKIMILRIKKEGNGGHSGAFSWKLWSNSSGAFFYIFPKFNYVYQEACEANMKSPFRWHWLHAIPDRTYRNFRAWKCADLRIFRLWNCQTFTRAVAAAATTQDLTKETILERADFALQLLMFVTAEKGRIMFISFFLSIFCQLLSLLF